MPIYDMPNMPLYNSKARTMLPASKRALDVRPGRHVPNGFPHLSSKTRACICRSSCCLGKSGCICPNCSGVGHENCNLERAKRARARKPRAK